jgi:hypothetical protein
MTLIASSGDEEARLEKELASVHFGLHRCVHFAARLDTPMGLGGAPEREENVRRKKRARGCVTVSNSSKNSDSTTGLW